MDASKEGMTGTGVICSTPNLYIPWHKFLQSSTAWSATEPPSRFRRSKFSRHATGSTGDLPWDWFRSTLAAMYCCCKDSKFTAVTTITTLPGYKNNEQRAEIRLALISSSRPWPAMIFQLNEKKMGCGILQPNTLDIWVQSYVRASLARFPGLETKLVAFLESKCFTALVSRKRGPPWTCAPRRWAWTSLSHKMRQDDPIRGPSTLLDLNLEDKNPQPLLNSVRSLSAKLSSKTQQSGNYCSMWRFPKMGVPPNYSFNLDVAFHYKW